MADYNVAVIGRAFLLRPDTPREGRPRPRRPGESDNELSEPLRSYAAEASLVMRPPARTPNTMYALEATEHAQGHGKFLEFHRGIYRAHWEEGKDIGSIDTLLDAARQVGLNAEELRQRLESGHYTETILEQYQEATDRGINAIPAFLVGNLLFTGAQPYRVFEMAMRRVLAEAGQAAGQ